MLIFATLFEVSLSLGPGLSIKNVYLYIIIGALTIRSIVERPVNGLFSQVVPLATLHLTFIFLIFYAICSWLWLTVFPVINEYNPIRGFISLKGYLIDYYLVLAAFFFAIQKIDDVVAAAKSIIVMVIVVNCITALDGFGFLSLGIVEGVKDSKNWGPMGNSNQYGTFLIFFLPSMVVLANSKSTTKKVVFGLGTIVSVVMLIATLSRGAYVGLVAGGALASWLMRAELGLGKSAVRYVGIGVVALGIAWATGQWENLYDRTVGLTARATDAEELSSGRMGIWGKVLAVQIAHPVSLVVGMGWDSYDQGRQFRLSTHNTYLLYMYELGLIGLALYCLVLRRILKQSTAIVRYAESTQKQLIIGFVFGFCGLIIATIFGNLYVPWLYILAYTGLILRLGSLISEKVSAREAI